jgi:hypothetical protein
LTGNNKEGGHVWLTAGFSLEKEFPPFLELLQKLVLQVSSLISI